MDMFKSVLSVRWPSQPHYPCLMPDRAPTHSCRITVSDQGIEASCWGAKTLAECGTSDSRAWGMLGMDNSVLAHVTNIKASRREAEISAKYRCTCWRPQRHSQHSPQTRHMLSKLWAIHFYRIFLSSLLHLQMPQSALASTLRFLAREASVR